MRIMVLFFMVAISGDVYTQEKGTPEKEKYDFYRKRLKEQFMYY